MKKGSKGNLNLAKPQANVIVISRPMKGRVLSTKKSFFVLSGALMIYAKKPRIYKNKRR